MVELGAVGGVGLRLGPRRRQLVERRDQRLGDVPASIRAVGLHRLGSHAPASLNRGDERADPVGVFDARGALQRRGGVHRPRMRRRRSPSATLPDRARRPAPPGQGWLPPRPSGRCRRHPRPGRRSWPPCALGGARRHAAPAPLLPRGCAPGRGPIRCRDRPDPPTPPPTASRPVSAARRRLARGLSGTSTNPARSAPAAAATATSSGRVSPHTLARGRARSSASLAAGSGDVISVDPTRMASAPASSAAAPSALVRMPDSATTTRPGGIDATRSSWRRRSMANVSRSRALTPTTGASRAMARASSVASCASTRVSNPRSAATSMSPLAASSSRSRSSRSTASAPMRAGGLQVALGGEEALGQQRHLGGGAGSGEIGPTAGKSLVDQHRDRRRTGPGVAAARAAGSASGRRSPAEGERRLISATAASPGAASAAANRAITTDAPG